MIKFIIYFFYLGGVIMSGILEHKCPACGASVVFDAKKQKVSCPYCGTEFEVNEFADKSEEFKNDAVTYGENIGQSLNDEVSQNRAESMLDKGGHDEGAFGERTDETDGDKYIDKEFDLYTCNSCAAELLCDENTVATKCPYCDSEIVFTGRVSNQLKPDFIIPFKIDKKAAKKALVEHYKNKILLPKVFKDENHIDEIKGIYVPYWIYDYGVQGSAVFDAEIVSYYSDSEYDYIKTDFYDVVTEGKCVFDSIPADGSSKLDDTLMESIEPFNYDDKVDFQSIYLSGFLSDKYDVSSDEVESTVKLRAENSLLDELRNSVVGYDSVSPKYHNIEVTDKNLKYAMMPVWILNTTWNKNKYIFAMNGQTGKFVGDLPIDKKKLSIISIISFIIFFIIGALIFLR